MITPTANERLLLPSPLYSSCTPPSPSPSATKRQSNCFHRPLHDPHNPLTPTSCIPHVAASSTRILSSSSSSTTLSTSPTIDSKAPRRRLSYSRRSQKTAHRLAIRRIINASYHQQQHHLQSLHPLSSSVPPRLGSVTEVILRNSSPLHITTSRQCQRPRTSKSPRPHSQQHPPSSALNTRSSFSSAFSQLPHCLSTPSLYISCIHAPVPRTCSPLSSPILPVSALVLHTEKHLFRHPL